jgi:hypothetical protein
MDGLYASNVPLSPGNMSPGNMCTLHGRKIYIQRNDEIRKSRTAPPSIYNTIIRGCAITP